MSGGIQSGLGPEQIPLGGIGAPGQLGGLSGGGGGGTDVLGGFIKMFQTLQQENGVKTVAEMAAEKGTPPDLSQLPGGGFGSTDEIAQPQAQPTQPLGQLLAFGGRGIEAAGTTPQVSDAALGVSPEEPEEQEAAKRLGLTPQQAQVLAGLSRRPPPQIPRALSPPRRPGTVAPGQQFGVNQLAQPPLSLAQILGRA